MPKLFLDTPTSEEEIVATVEQEIPTQEVEEPKEEPIVEIEKPSLPPEELQYATFSTINSVLSNKLNEIDSINSAIVSLNELDRKDLVGALQTILDDAMIHVGILQELYQKLMPLDVLKQNKE